MSQLRDGILVLAITTVGLSAGLLSAFAYAVMPGLDRADAQVAVVAMQRINVAILNPVFALIFFGGLLFGALGIALWWQETLRWWLIVAVVLYLVALLITMGVNVPLNTRLDGTGSVSAADAPTVWEDFVRPWVQWNIVRALAAVAAFAVMLVGLVQTRG
ncbi:DUF1772 domain-containing protein [Gordonia hankookensis]|uniref:DUF1772 domain-containing protein n=1 Tax=Gordonia hankookensis TaxID=589403 RepID=A0ABR7WD84_9ACTN|nr:anthrone oxygenase family protein [Gordonia hankookensis]MBD1319694.1 DUF1772 domain-containing protein [Gordonia hankookensis]